MDLSAYVGKETEQNKAKGNEALNWHDVNAPHKPTSDHKLSYIGSFANSAYSALTGNGSNAESEVATYAGGFAKAACLFLRGRFALPATMLAYALDEAKPGDSASNQLLDAGLGAAKGGAMRGAFSLSAGIDNVAGKGVMLGITSRATELGLSRSTYFDRDNGSFNLGQGLDRLQQGVFSKQALGMDIIAFGASSGLVSGIDRLASGAVTRSPLFSTMLTGTTFGITTGGLQELQRQGQTGNLDINEVAKRAAIQGALDMVAAIPGGMQARTAFRSQFEHSQNLALNYESLTGAKLNDATASLGRAKKIEMQILAANSERMPDFSSEKAFIDSAIRPETVPGRKYTYRGVEIAVPEDYAAQLDAVRRYRKAIDNVPANQHEILAQQILGKDAALRNRALPEDFMHAIDLLPDRSFTRRLNLLNTPNPENAWHQKQTGDPTFTSAAVAGKNADITFFQRDANRWLSVDLTHEWSHMLRDRTANESWVFDSAASLEAGGHMRRTYANRSKAENFAVHTGEQFLHPDANVFRALAQEAPLRTAAIAHILKPILQSSASPSANMYRDRVRFVEQSVLPQVRTQLADIIKQGPGDPRHTDASNLLSAFMVGR